jgi:hypothetical protein
MPNEPWMTVTRPDSLYPALAALPDVIVGHPRRYSPWLTHDLENDGESAGRMRA